MKSDKPNPFVLTRQFTFPVPSGTVVINIPFPMLNADYDALISCIELWRNGLVKKTPERR